MRSSNSSAANGSDLAKLGVRNPKKSQDRGLIKIDDRKRSIDDEANRLSINKSRIQSRIQSRIIVNNQNRGV